MMRILSLLGVLACAAGGPAVAQSNFFGDDSSEWSNDGECDDPRFEGSAMTQTPLLESDIAADATDCRTGYEQGLLRLRGADISTVDFGDDSGDWSNDGECDDPRFRGPGMTDTPLLDDDIRRDATDCRNAFRLGGLIQVRK